MQKIHWPVTIGLNLFRGFISGTVFVLSAPTPPPGGVIPTILMMAIFGPPMFLLVRYIGMRIAMVIPFGLILQVFLLIVTGLPFIIADLVVWLILTIFPNTFSLQKYPPFSMAAYIIIYESGELDDLGFDLPESWRRGS